MSADSELSRSTPASIRSSVTVLAACILALGSSAAFAVPTVSGTTISWPDDGWYQVQSSVDYRSICQGGRSCEVAPGVYNVINLSTGKRFEKITVAAATTPTTPPVTSVSVTGNVISWPNDGWYQVQSASDYRSICQGGRSCTVSAGRYHVINLTTGKRFENIQVGATTPTTPTTPVTPPAGLPVAPANPRVSYYSNTTAEIFWDRFPASSGVVSTEVLRDGIKIGTSNGNSYFDKTRADSIGYRYSLIAINGKGQRSPAVEVTPVAAQSILTPATAEDAGDNGTVLSVSGNSAFFGSPYSNQFAGSVQIYAADAQGKWTEAQVLNGESDAYAGRFGQGIDVEGDTVAITESTSEGGVAHIYKKDGSGLWYKIQTLVPPTPLEGLGEGSVALSGNTLLLREQGAVIAYRKTSQGTFAYEKRLASDDPAVAVYGFDGEIALDGNTAAFGTVSDGRVFVFQRDSAGQWSQQAILSPSLPYDGIVNSIAVKGNTLAVGTLGNVFIFTRGSNGTWSQTQRIDDLAVAYQSVVVTLDDTRLILGTNAEDGLTRMSGTAQIHTRQADGKWAFSKRLFAQDGNRLGEFGEAVALDGNNLFVAGYSQINLINFSRRPAAYVFKLN